MMAEMAAALKEKLAPSLKVVVSIGFDYPTINKLAKYIESELDNNLIKTQVPKSSTKQVDDSIAIIGMSCSLPNAPDIAAFETLLEKGMSGMKDIPIERWDNSKYYDSNMDAPRKSYVTKLGLIEHIKDFDAQFFGISPREAKLIEPQQRIFLECCYKALENANYYSESLRSSLTGVFAGVGPNEFYAQLEKSGFSNEELSTYSITGNALNLIPGRVAYTFDFTGPSISVDTACSSSLVAIHYACQSLKNREIDYALAGGVNILLMPESNITLCKAKALSPDGQCNTFDEKANGYARAEGCGVIVLKRLSDALRDKDSILAVIKGSAVNNDGKSAGLIVPNGKRQEEVMMKALSQTDLSIDDISYIEAHGTGTPLGDPIEVHAISKVYGNQRSKDNPLYLGTVKTNIGHLESASGIAGLIKTIISLQKKKIYKHLNFNKLNPNIELNDMRIALHNTDWNSTAKLKCAGVNSYGFSGTNAHIILQEFPREKTQKITKPTQAYLLVLSAKSKNSLDNLAKRYQQYLKTTEHDFSDICFTAATCRAHYPYRLAVCAERSAEASQLLHTGKFASSHEKNNSLNLQNDPALKSLLIEYLDGKQVNWALFYKNSGYEFRTVLLPNYAFDRSEFWPDKKSENSAHMHVMHPILGQLLSMPGNEYLFSHKLDLESLSYIKQSSVFEKVIFPASAYIESGLAAAQSLFKSKAFRIEHFNIERPLNPKQNQEFQLQVKPKNDAHFKISIYAKQDDNWQVFSEMELYSIPLAEPESVDINALKSFFGERVDLSQIYEHFKKRSIVYGDEFQVLQEGYVASDRVLSKVALTKTSHGLGYYYHPVLLEGAIQSIALLSINNTENSTYIPYAFTRMTTFQEAPRSMWVHVTKRDTDNEKELCVDIKLYDNSGLQIGDIEGLKLRTVSPNNFISYDFILHHLYQTRWNTLNLNLATQSKLPEFLVISKDPIKAKKLLGNINYQLIEKFNNLVTIENKNIIFLYEQGQFIDLFHCCQTLFKLYPKSFVLVTENAYSVNDKDQVNPYQTMASSFWKSFSNELGFNKNYTIDIDSNSTLVATLNYLFHTNNAENQCAIRDSIYIPRLKKTQMPIQQEYQEPLFDSNASYLITGGTGGLAKPLIEYLICRGVKQINLISRSECPMDIKALIESEKQKQVFISHYKADASNYQQMERVIERIEQSSKPLKGVFHLAGVVQDGLIVTLNEDDIQRVLSAKMDSALILHQLTKNIPLDMFVLFSSVASLLGSRGQSNYVAANGFLDGLAHLRKQQGLPAISINWGPFNSIGMTAKLTQGIQQHGFIPLDKDSIDILDVLLRSQLTQISPCPINWDIYFKHSPNQMWLSDLVKNTLPINQYFLNSLKQHTKEECVTILSQALCEITADVLALDNLDQITAEVGLFSMGLDSLMSIDIRNRIHDKLQCPTLSLSIEYFINDPTITKIARNIADELEDIFDNTTDIQSSEDSTGEEIALCDFQYPFWALNKLNYSYNTALLLQLSGKLNIDYLRKAFDFVIKQNSAFWISINKDAPTQRLKKQGAFKLIYEDISLNDEMNGLDNEFFNNMMRIIPLTELPLIRVYLYKINNDLHELHLVFPHIIVDEASCDIVLSQFKHSYEMLTLGKRLIQTIAKDSYFNYVTHNNLHYEKNLNDKIEFWRVYNKDVPMLHFGHANHWPDATVYQPQYLFHYPITPQFIGQFIDWHKAKNINISSGLIAACQIVFHKMSRQKKIPIILIHTGREGSQYKSIVGLFSEYKRINLSLNVNNKFIDCVQSVEEQLLKTAPYQKCPYLIKNSGLKGSRLSIGQYLAFKFNKLIQTKHFKESKLNSKIIDYYLEYLSRIESMKINSKIKNKLNKLFNWNIPLQKPDSLKVLINITPSFFVKESEHMSFANIDYTYPSYLGCLDRPIGNQTLWIYFSRNLLGEYKLSINGPITTECKEQIALNFNKIIAKFGEGTEYNITDLI